jgi:hypothetical protein
VSIEIGEGPAAYKQNIALIEAKIAKNKKDKIENYI